MKKNLLIALLILAGVGCATYGVLRQNQVDEEIPSRVTTVAKRPFGKRLDQIKGMSVKEHFTPTKVAGFQRFIPRVAVDDNGNVYMADNTRSRLSTDSTPPKPMNLFMFKPSGTLSRITWYPWAQGTSYIAHGAKDTLWFAGNVTGHNVREDEDYWKVVKANKMGAPAWEIGQRRGYNEGVWLPVQPSAKPGINLPLPHPPNYRAEEDKFMAIDGLFATKNGDVFVFASEGELRRFDASGRFLELYDFTWQDLKPPTNSALKPVSFSLHVARDGTVYNHLYGTQNPAGWIETLAIDVWKTPQRRVTRMIDLSGLGYVGYGRILLRGSDAKGNLYFQYRYSLDSRNDGTNMNSTLPRTGLAIARVGKDNKAIKVFDIDRHYKAETELARKRINPKILSTYYVGIGDIAHVAANGNIYLEVANGTHYRIDRISFE